MFPREEWGWLIESIYLLDIERKQIKIYSWNPPIDSDMPMEYRFLGDVEMNGEYPDFDELDKLFYRDFDMEKEGEINREGWDNPEGLGLDIDESELMKEYIWR